MREKKVSLCIADDDCITNRCRDDIVANLSLSKLACLRGSLVLCRALAQATTDNCEEETRNKRKMQRYASRVMPFADIIHTLIEMTMCEYIMSLLENYDAER